MKRIQYKWLIRTYVTALKWNHGSPDIPESYIKCLEEKGTSSFTVSGPVQTYSRIVKDWWSKCTCWGWKVCFGFTSKQVILTDRTPAGERFIHPCIGSKVIYPEIICGWRRWLDAAYWKEEREWNLKKYGCL